jgi:P-type E1-E2 ATPase
MKIPCDCILIAGDVMVNESLLTGESCPVRKTAVLKEVGYEKGNLVFEGTNIIKCKNYTQGIY